MKIYKIYTVVIFIACIILSIILSLQVYQNYDATKGGVVSEEFKRKLRYHGIGGEDVMLEGGQKIFYRNGERCKF
ncbi:MAG: hypothetical protein SV375_17330 [Thermodesulfobacteriota bacterium]|nr:hypothetical protein [Thermodesulfobacteriota bacterium]